MIQLTSYWLSILCPMIKGASHAVVFTSTPNNSSYQPTAAWPDKDSTIQGSPSAVKAVLIKKQSLLLQQKTSGEEQEPPLDMIACPLFLDKQLYGVIVLQLPRRTPTRQQAVMRQMERAAVWLEALIKQNPSTTNNQLVTIVELVASCLEHGRFQEAATDVATDLATRLSCERVSIGFQQRNGVAIAAISHSTGFDRRTNLVRAIGDAMQEAMEQDSSILYPESSSTTLPTRRHAALLEKQGSGTILTIPFGINRKITGAILLERPADRPFDEITAAHFKQIASLIGPLLEMRHHGEQWLPQKIHHCLQRFFSNLFGPNHLPLKLSFCSLLLGLFMLTGISGNYHITSSARVEAKTQRVVVAPQDGYISEAHVRPGDIVHTGDILGALDDKDLRLKQRQWSSQLEQLKTEHRDALASRERSKVSIIKARMLQAQAQLTLINEQLTRTRLTAPLDGQIVSGDLSQALGSPVERGQILFTAAPLDAYRVILKVDERDIGSVKKGQGGHLVLSGMPGTPLLFTVEKVTPVSIPQEGRNYFQVEAKMDGAFEQLRPGMEGVAKIDISRRKLIWIWTHKLLDWMQLTLWAWLP